FSWKNSNVNMITWTTRAMAAMMQNTSSQNCIAAPRVPLGDGTPCYRLTKFLRRLRLAQIRFAPGFYCGRDRILFAYGDFLAALNQFIGALAQCVLTAILIRMRLLGFRIAQLAQNFFRVFSRDHAAQFFQPSSLNIGDAPEFFQ